MGCVYFFKHNKLSPIKIGFTSNDSPIKRFNQFKTLSPYGGVILGVIKSDEPLFLEQQLHNIFNEYRLNGEWFDLALKDIHPLKGFDLFQKIEDEKEIFKQNEAFEFIENYIDMGLRLYNNGFLLVFNDFFNLPNNNIEGLEILSVFCDFHDCKLETGRDKTGKYFKITNKTT